MPSTADGGLLTAALVATGVVLVAAVVLFRAWLVRQLHVHAVEAPPDAGDEPPAIVNFLTHRFRTTREAAAATVLDLADRGVVTIDEVGPELSLVDLRPQAAEGELADFELQVLEALADRAIDGELPSDAGTLGPEDLSRRWWGRFETAVLAEASARGLVARSRVVWWGPILIIAVMIPPALAFVAFHGDPERAMATVWSTALIAVTVVPGLVFFLRLRPQPLPTPEGRQAAARWLGARDQLASTSVPEHGPAGVRVWGRHLANAAAMGLAPEVVRSLPYGAEDPHHAWSTAGGRWRRVRITYRRWRPCWGRRPSTTLVQLTIVVVLASGFGVALHRVEGADIAEPVAGALLLLALVGALGVAACLVDLVSDRTVEGEVIRVQYVRPSADAGAIEILQGAGWFLVVDDGTSSTLPAWSIDRDDASELVPGQRLRVEVTPCLGYVVGYEPG